MDWMENSDEDYAFREQIKETMTASAHQYQHQGPDEFLMAIRFQEMLEHQFSSQGKSDTNEVDDEVEWRGVVEEYKKLSTIMEELNLNAIEDKWADALQEFHHADDEDEEEEKEEEFSEATCSLEWEEEEGESDGGFFSLYFKGVSEMKESASGVGVVIRRGGGGEVLLQVQKRLGYYVEESVAEHLALIEGLKAALQRGLRRVNAFTDSPLVYDHIARARCLDNHELLLALRPRVLHHVRELDDFVLSLNVDSADCISAMLMAREAICPLNVLGSHAQFIDDDDEEEEEEHDLDENGVLYVGLGQKRQRRYKRGSFHGPAWGEVSKFNQRYPRTRALGMHSWREREKGIGEWKFL